MADSCKEDQSKHDDQDKEIREMFMMSVEKCAGKKLPKDQKCICKSNAVKKMLEETFHDKKMIHCMDASVYPKYQDRTTKTLTVEKFIDNVLPDLAKEKVGKGKPHDEELKKMKCKLCEKCKEWKEPPKTEDKGVVKRLTDSSGYTGAHKERFDASGKGKGKEGRVEKVDGSGYVGGYKGKDTYDSKH